MIGASLLVFAAVAPPAETPVGSLRFETGRHTAAVRDVTRDPLSGDWVTVGDDKAVRRWHDGKPAGSPLRFASSALGNGAFASCDVSAKGLLAVGDADRQGPSVWLYDLSKGVAGSVKRMRIPRGTEENPSTAFVSLAFSPKGDLVAAGDDAGTIRIWDVAKGSLLATQNIDKTRSRSVFGLAFNGARIAYAMADNQGDVASDQKGYVGVLDANGLTPGPAIVLDHRTVSLDWHDPNAIVVGGSRGKLDLWKPGDAQATPIPTGLDDPRFVVTAVARSADGRTTVAGTILGDLLVYSGAGAPKTISPRSRVSYAKSMELSPDGRTIVVAHGNGETYEVALAGGKPVVLSPANPEVTDVRWSDDGHALRWKTNGVSAGFDLAGSGPGIPKTVAPEPGRRRGGASLSFEGNVVKIEGVPGFTSIVERANVRDAVFLDESHILVATDIGLRIFDGPRADPGYVTVDGAGPTSLAVSPDGKNVAAGFADGLVRIYPTKGLGAEPLASLFVGGGEWVAWQEKTGLYDSSVGGDSVFGFQVNRGDAALATFVPALMKEKEFRRPGLLPKLFGGGGLPTPPTVALATAITEVPAIAVVGVEGAQKTDAGWEVKGDTAKVTVKVQNRTGGGKVSVRVGHGTSRDIDGLIDVPNPNPTERVCTVTGLAPGANLVRIFVGGEPLAGSDFTIVNAQPGQSMPERLIVLSIGVGEYATPEMKQRNLAYAAKDADGFVEAVEACSLVDEKPIVKLLKDKDATRDAILKAIAWLQTTAKPTDRVMVFMASHGVRTDEATYITPHDYEMADPKRTGLAWPMITEELRKIPGKSLVLFTDNCRSGAAVASARLTDMATATDKATLEMRGLKADMSVFAACDASQESFEDPALGHGLFTYALLKGLRGEIPGQSAPKSGIITVDWLKAFLPDYLNEVNRTGATQTPRIMVPDWPIPVSRKRTKVGA